MLTQVTFGSGKFLTERGVGWRTRFLLEDSLPAGEVRFKVAGVFQCPTLKSGNTVRSLGLKTVTPAHGKLRGDRVVSRASELRSEP